MSTRPIGVCINDIGEAKDGKRLGEVAVKIPDCNCPAALWRILLQGLLLAGSL
jgi:hypothetical protein